MKITRNKVILSNFFGNIFETYDLLIYGILAPHISLAFFGGINSRNILYTFAVLFVGYLARPIGAIFFGYMADIHGRKKAVVFSLFIVSICTVLVGVLPSYGQVGMLSPLLLLTCRLLQSLALGGEYTNSIIFLVEHGKDSGAGYNGSWATNGNCAGFLLASLTGFLVTTLISNQLIPMWSWRFCFFFSIGGIFLSFWIDRNVSESLSYILENSIEKEKPFRGYFSSFLQAITQQKGRILGVSILLWLSVTFTYLIFVYAPTHIMQHSGISMTKSLIVNTVSLAVIVLLTPISGYISDKIGREIPIIVASLIFVFFSYPFFSSISSGNLFHLFIFEIILAFGASLIYGIFPVLMVEAMPVGFKGISTSLLYNLIACILGGSSPLIAIELIKLTANAASPGIYLASVASITALSTILLKGVFLPNTKKEKESHNECLQ